MTATFLEMEGMQVLQARDGREALALIASRAFDAVLMDIRMPRLDGLAATRLLRELEPSRRLKVLAFTAVPEEIGKQRHLFTEILAKPIAFSEVLAALKKHLG
jgi:two-component system, sensor histidine kinase and response regulator